MTFSDLGSVLIAPASALAQDAPIRATDDAPPLRDLLRDAATETGMHAAVFSVVQALRTDSYGVANFLDDIAAIKAEAAAEPAEEALARWRQIDSIAEAVLKLDAASKAAVLTTAQRGYARIHPDGHVQLANPALLKLLPDAVGRSFADYFGSDRGLVRDLLLHGGAQILHLTLDTPSGPAPVAAEFAPIIVDKTFIGSYALIVDLRTQTENQITSFEVAPFGIARLDKAHRINFLNEEGGKILGEAVDVLEGVPLTDLFGPPAVGKVQAALDRCEQGKGSEMEVDFTRAHLSSPIPLRCYSIPEFDSLRRPKGSLFLFRSLQRERARDRIRDLCERPGDPIDLLRRVMKVVREVLPFDDFGFGVYSDQMAHFRSLIAPSGVDSPQRWFAIPEGLRTWITGEQTWGDLDTFFDEHPEAEIFREHPFVQGLRDLGYQSFLCLPVRRSDEARNVVTLYSGRPDAFGPAHLELLRLLTVDVALQVIDEECKRRRDRRIAELLNEFAASTSHQQLALAVARGVADIFRIEHCSIFRVDRTRGHFALVEQVNRTDDPCYSLPNNRHKQGLSEGMLGAALGAKKLVCLQDASVPNHNLPYIPLCNATRSGACMPIELDGTAAWVINAEARDTYVFFGPDQQLLQSLVCKIREVLDGRFRAVLTEHILDLTEQGIIIVDAKGRIRRANRTAEAFLGAPAAALLDRTLSEFAADGQSKEVLEGTEATVSRHVHLLTASGKASAFLASRSCLGEEYDHKIWLLTDVQQLNWNVELRYLRATVNEVAQQTRVPLLFAGSLVQRARQRLAGTAVEPEVGEFVDKAMEQLGKVGITYERLAANLTLRDGSQSMAGFDVHALLRSIQKELPNTDQPFVDLPPAGGSLVVEGQIDQFHFVFRSILFFLLNRRPLDAHVRVNLEREAEYALVELVAPYAAKDSPADVSSTNPIYRATAEARLVAALAPEAIRSVVEGHGGRFVGPIPRGSEIAFQVRLPAQAGDFL